MIMKFSDETISILKNFSGINQSILFKPGNVLKTISPQKTVMSAATISEDVSGRAGIYDLSRFLSTLSLFEDPDVDFKEDRFTISSGRRKVDYTYAAENMIVTPPDKDIKLPHIDVSMNVAWTEIQAVIRAAGVLQVGDISFTGKDGHIVMAATDGKNPTADRYEVEVSEYSGEDFDMTIKVENLKLIPADYEINLSSKGMSHFKSTKVQYWIAVQSN